MLVYCECFGIDIFDLVMVVVIMLMLLVLVVGIVFMCDLLMGCDDYIVVNVYWGLGEVLVGGYVDGDVDWLEVVL